ncbi:Ldh family oxidoreductase [Nioella sp.]|uniref:Ldh family oxidoreductase n=1 Tax=Nioella sp. TaxID=1912091 RepID=UPI003B52AB5B
MTSTSRIGMADATDLLFRAFRGAGLTGDAARSVATALVSAEAEGQVGHGFSRLSDYVAQARSGKVNAGAVPSARALSPTQIVVDADHGFAFPALDLAVDQGLEVAGELGMASVAITRSHHAGALSVQVDRIARAGFIGLMMANTPKAIAPWGGSAPVFGTNPIAFAVPRDGADPLVIDLSLSQVARGKVMHAKKSGLPIPEGWALDAEGQPTTDPEAALQGSMMPIGGAKGTALALMVEILSTVLTSAAFSAEAGSFFTADGPPPGVGQFLLILRPDSPAHDFAARLETLLSLVSAEDGTRLPGERRLKQLRAAQLDGLCVPVHYLAIAHELADRPATQA